MNFARQRVVFGALLVLILAWVIAGTGFWLAGQMKVTPDKVLIFLRETHLAELQGRVREKAVEQLGKMMARLTPQERRDIQLTSAWRRWILEMTDNERGDLLEATLPSGIQQMLASFEELPEDRRLRALNDAYKRLREAQNELARADPEESSNTNDLPELSPELQERALRTGLKTFYSESSAQTKAEMAPLLEEIQRSMESGRLFRPTRQRGPDPQSPASRFQEPSPSPTP